MVSCCPKTLPVRLCPPPHPTQNAKDTASCLFAGSVLLGTAGTPEACAGGMAPPSSGAAAVEGGLGLEERRHSSLEASTSLGVFELIEGSAAEAAGGSPAWTRARPPPLTLAELNTFFDAEGGWLCSMLCFVAMGAVMRVHLLHHLQTTPCEPMPWHELLWRHGTMPCKAQSASWHDRSQHAMPCHAMWTPLSELCRVAHDLRNHLKPLHCARPLSTQAD